MAILHSTLLFFLLIEIINGSGYIQRDIIFMIDVSATVGTSGVTASVTLCKDLANNYPIFDDTVRVGAITFYDSVINLFDLNTYDNYEDIASGLETASYQGGNGDIGVALDYVRNRYTGGNNGDRTGVADIMVMITDGITVNMLTAGTSANNAGWEIHIIGVSPSAFSFYIDQVADHSYYANTYTVMYTTVYESVKTTLPSNSQCGNYWIRYDEPANLISTTDSSTSTAFVLFDNTFKVTCCGVVNIWSFYATTSGQITFQVWRQSGSSYYVVGQNSYTVSASEIGTTISYTVTAGERIAIQENDRIGWYCSGTNIIPYATCTTASRGNCPQYNLKASMSSVSTGSTYDWATIYGSHSASNTAYAIKWYTADNTAPTFASTTTTISISDSTAVGSSVLTASFTETDQGDTLSYNLTDTYYEVDSSGVIRIKATLPSGATDTVSSLTVTAEDTCQNTATGSFTITSYNVPPYFTGLPASLSLSEDTTPETKVLDIGASSDAICCSLSGSTPSTTNFKLVNSGGYAVYLDAGSSLNYDVASKYTLYICCDDGIVSNTSYLQVIITDISTSTPTQTQSFVATGLMVCLIPIGLLFGLSCALLMVTVWVR